MASTRNTPRKGKVLSTNSNSSRKRKLNNEECEVLQADSSEIELDVEVDSDHSKLMTDDSDLGLETVEVDEEIDVTEELIVSIEDDDQAQLVEEQVETEVLFDPLLEVETVTVTPGEDVAMEEVATSEKSGPAFVFKVPNFVHSSKGPGAGRRTRIWKNLKQITTAERSVIKDPDVVTYGSIDSPPSFKPAKKYSDISGLEARYTDPQTKMRYSTTEEFQRVRLLPGDIISGCLALRKANILVP